MGEQFIPYEQALELKELGFNEDCFGGWDKHKIWYYHPDSDIEVDAPLWQQAFDFFREKYYLLSRIDAYREDKRTKYFFNFTIYSYSTGFLDKRMLRDCNNWFKTYEEARLECLKKLIEIVKDK